MKSRTLKTLLPLLLALLALPAGARDFGGLFGQPLPHVAQMSQEERRALRERWEQASPEERADLRRMFQDRMRRMPSVPFAPPGMDMGERVYERWQEEGFGTGYEQRRHEDDRYDDKRSGYGNDRQGRGRR
jgi:hypothetical protein